MTPSSVCDAAASRAESSGVLTCPPDVLRGKREEQREYGTVEGVPLRRHASTPRVKPSLQLTPRSADGGGGAELKCHNVDDQAKIFTTLIRYFSILNL